MLKKTITYEDFNGDTVTEDYYFHLSKAELIELEVGAGSEGLAASLQKIIDAEDGKAIIEQFKTIILAAYGKRSEDGKRFIKNQELRDEFVSTEAYSALFMNLATDTNAAIEFINGIVPSGLSEEAAKLRSSQEAAAQLAAPPETPKVPETPEPLAHDISVDQPQPRIVSKEEVAAMSEDEVVTLGQDVMAGRVKLEK